MSGVIALRQRVFWRVEETSNIHMVQYIIRKAVVFFVIPSSLLFNFFEGEAFAIYF